jgi:hypothetical protein
MTTKREGYHNVFVQLPEACWDAVSREADESGESAAKVLSRIIAKHYKIPSSALPKPKRSGRKPGK